MVRTVYNTMRLVKGRLLKTYKRDGYNIVQLCKEGSIKCLKVSRLVWSAFNGPIPEGMQVNHINEVRDEDRLGNLNLMTCKENINWGNHTERMIATRHEKKQGWLPVKQYSLTGEFIAEYQSIRIAEKVTGTNNSCISLVCKGKRKSAGGFIWKYV